LPGKTGQSVRYVRSS